MTGLQEFCQTEVFKAQCSEGEVIAMTRAMYGRMRIGRCVTTDYGHVGCDENVLVETDRRCSGRRECEVRIPDAVFDAFKPCPIEFKTYFEAEYTCVGVAMADARICDTSDDVSLSAPAGYLSNQVAASTKVGSTNCPWKITLNPGQRINVTLIDFARPLLRPSPAQRQQQHGSLCYQYALITERKGTTRTTRVCGGETRVRHVYISRSNVIEIRIIRRTNRDADEYFLLKYEAVGCSLLENQEHGWIQYDEFGAIIGCNHSEDTWRLSCRDNAWYGMRGNCTTGVSIGIIVGLAIIVGVIILLVGLICLEWRKMKPEEGEEVQAAGGVIGVSAGQDSVLVAPHQVPKGSIYVKHSELLQGREVRLARPGLAPLNHQGAAGGAGVGAELRDSDYAYVREMWPMVSPHNHLQLSPRAAGAANDPLGHHHEQLGAQQWAPMGMEVTGSVLKPPCGGGGGGGSPLQALSSSPTYAAAVTYAGSVSTYAGSASTSTVPTNLPSDDDEDDSDEESDDPGDVHIYESPKSLRRAARDPHYLPPADSSVDVVGGTLRRGSRGTPTARSPHTVHACDTSVLSPVAKSKNDSHRIF